MNRIDQLFAKKGKDILSIYFTAGHPKLDSTEKIILTLDEAGVDLVEIGIPYSDPMADGPTIQESGSLALQQGMKLDLLFDQLKKIRNKTQMPLLMMGYLNQMMQYGIESFFDQCARIGIDGLIIPDLPVDIYEMEIKKYADQHGLHMIFLITPQTSESRIREIDRLASGFIYMVADASITGAKSGISQRQIEYFERINAMSLQNPRLIGFGISNHETFTSACQYASGAIIGSAFIKAIDKATDLTTTIRSFVSTIRDATPVTP